MSDSEARELEIAVDRNSPVPLYFQVARAIESAINSGVLAPGDRLENELSLTSRLGLSRPTARQAIQELVQKGLLVRKRGVGTQVVRSSFSRDERLTSLHDDLVDAGRIPSTRLLSYRVGPLEPSVAESLDREIARGDFLEIRRLRSADGVPLAVLTNYLPARFDIGEEDLRGASLYGCLRALGVNLKIAHQRISARLLTEQEAQWLGDSTPAAGLTVDRIAYDDTGSFVEFGRHLYRSAHYSIQSNLMV